MDQPVGGRHPPSPVAVCSSCTRTGSTAPALGTARPARVRPRPLLGGSRSAGPWWRWYATSRSDWSRPGNGPAWHTPANSDSPDQRQQCTDARLDEHGVFVSSVHAPSAGRSSYNGLLLGMPSTAYNPRPSQVHICRSCGQGRTNPTWRTQRTPGSPGLTRQCTCRPSRRKRPSWNTQRTAGNPCPRRRCTARRWRYSGPGWRTQRTPDSPRRRRPCTVRDWRHSGLCWRTRRTPDSPGRSRPRTARARRHTGPTRHTRRTPDSPR